jgi:hypothetical protein
MTTGRTILSMSLMACGLAAAAIGCSASDTPARGAGAAGADQRGSGGWSTGAGGWSTGTGGWSTGAGGWNAGAGGTTGYGGTTTGAGGTTGYGGTTTGAGGSTGTGGSTSAACTPGSDASTLVANGTKPGYGKSTDATWKGYAFTFVFAAGGAVTPSGDAAFEKAGQTASLCLCGSIPAADAAGAGFGWTIGQDLATTSTPPAIVPAPITKPVHVTLNGGWAAGMRVQLTPPTGDAYCADLPAADHTFQTSDFKTQCWTGGTSVPYAGAAIQSIQVTVPGSASGAKTFNFCVKDIEPG